MCMWCNATRNLERPYVDWNKSYLFYSKRDSAIFDAEPIPGVLDPPLSFVQSVLAIHPNGREETIMFSPENEDGIEDLINSFKAGTSNLSQLFVNAHLSMQFAEPARKKLSKRGLDITFQPLPAPVPPIVLSTSAVNASFLYPRAVSRDTYIRASSTGPGHRPETPGATGTSSSVSLQNHGAHVAPDSRPGSVIRSGTSGPEKKIGLWKVFNPALCRTEEMPKLLILRDCTVTIPPTGATQPSANAASSGPRARQTTPDPVVKIEEDSDFDEDLDEDEEEKILNMLRRGTFDIGSIDYRGHFDYSFSSWFVRAVPRHDSPPQPSGSGKSSQAGSLVMGRVNSNERRSGLAPNAYEFMARLPPPHPASLSIPSISRPLSVSTSYRVSEPKSPPPRSSVSQQSADSRHIRRISLTDRQANSSGHPLPHPLAHPLATQTQSRQTHALAPSDRGGRRESYGGGSSRHHSVAMPPLPTLSGSSATTASTSTSSRPLAPLPHPLAAHRSLELNSLPPQSQAQASSRPQFQSHPHTQLRSHPQAQASGTADFHTSPVPPPSQSARSQPQLSANASLLRNFGPTPISMRVPTPPISTIQSQEPVPQPSSLSRSSSVSKGRGGSVGSTPRPYQHPSALSAGPSSASFTNTGSATGTALKRPREHDPDRANSDWERERERERPHHHLDGHGSLRERERHSGGQHGHAHTHSQPRGSYLQPYSPPNAPSSASTSTSTYSDFSSDASGGGPDPRGDYEYTREYGRSPPTRGIGMLRPVRASEERDVDVIVKTERHD